MNKSQKQNKTSSNTISASAWKKLGEQTRMLTLPSGAVVEIRQLNLLQAAATGSIPIQLLNASKKTGNKLVGTADLEQKELDEMMDLVNRVVVAVVVNPVVTTDGTGGSIKVESEAQMSIVDNEQKTADNTSVSAEAGVVAAEEAKKQNDKLDILITTVGQMAGSINRLVGTLERQT